MDGTPQHYFDLLKSAYPILKAANSNSIVLCIGSAQLGPLGDYTFTKSVFPLVGGAFTDALSVHAYPYQLNLGKDWSHYRQLWTSELAQYKQYGKPIWITETGLGSDQKSEVDQATYLQESYLFSNCREQLHTCGMNLTTMFFQLESRTGA